jgi:hypothetical protein
MQLMSKFFTIPEQEKSILNSREEQYVWQMKLHLMESFEMKWISGKVKTFFQHDEERNKYEGTQEELMRKERRNWGVKFGTKLQNTFHVHKVHE